MGQLRQCINSYGKAKKTFKTFEEAVTQAKKNNLNPKNIWAQQAYKCKTCLKFHTGRNPHKIPLNHKINVYKES